MTRTKEFPVSEIFGPTIQGEGAQIGRPTVFVRFGGCDYRCSWCDSLYAVLPEYRQTWVQMSAERILQEVALLASPPYLITLSGGNPALWDLAGLIQLGQTDGYSFTMETQGSVRKSWFSHLDHLCVSPKPPSSGMETDWEALADVFATAPADTICKVVVFDNTDPVSGRNDDWKFVRRVREFLVVRPMIPLYLQVGNTNPTQKEQADPLQMLRDLEWLANKVIAEGWPDVRVLPQLHALMWGNKRGV